MTAGSNQIHHWVTGCTVIMLLVLSACTPIASEQPKPQPEEKPVPVTIHCSALEYYEMLSAIPAEVLPQVESTLRVNLGQTSSICHQLQLVMLLTIPESAAKHDEEAEQILRDIQHTKSDLAPLDRQIVQLLSDQIRWRKKIRSNQQRLKQQLKKERAASIKLQEQQLKKERAASIKLQEQLSEAQSKLKQLKNIEQNINQQEQEISTPSTDKIPHEAE